MLFPLEMRSQRAAVEENPNLVVYGRARDEMPTLRLAPRSCARLEKAGPHLSSLFVTIPFCRTHSSLGWLPESPRDFSGLVHLSGHSPHLPHGMEMGCSFISTREVPGGGLEEEIFEEGMSSPEPLGAPLF